MLAAAQHHFLDVAQEGGDVLRSALVHQRVAALGAQALAVHHLQLAGFGEQLVAAADDAAIAARMTEMVASPLHHTQ